MLPVYLQVLHWVHVSGEVHRHTQRDNTQKTEHKESSLCHTTTGFAVRHGPLDLLPQLNQTDVWHVSKHVICACRLLWPSRGEGLHFLLSEPGPDHVALLLLDLLSAEFHERLQAGLQKSLRGN